MGSACGGGPAVLVAGTPSDLDGDGGDGSRGVRATALPGRAPPPARYSVGDLMRVGLPASRADRLAIAAARMRRAGTWAMPVVERGLLVGLISERDLLRAVADGISTDVAQVGDHMAAASPGIGMAVAAAAAAELMIALHARHLPVLDDGRVVGLVSACDLLAEWGVPRDLLGDGAW